MTSVASEYGMFCSDHFTISNVECMPAVTDLVHKFHVLSISVLLLYYSSLLYLPNCAHVLLKVHYKAHIGINSF